MKINDFPYGDYEVSQVGPVEDGWVPVEYEDEPGKTYYRHESCVVEE